MPQFVHSFSKRDLFIFLILISVLSCKKEKPLIELQKNNHIVIIGNNLASRMMHYGFFETELHLRFPDSTLFIRNMSDGGNTLGFRPHSGRNTPWAFPGAEKYYPEYSLPPSSEGHFETPDQWLQRLKADIIIAFFGYNEAQRGPEGIEKFSAELQEFIEHTKKQYYNSQSPPQLVLVSPTAFEDLSDFADLPTGEETNLNLRQYTDTLESVSKRNKVAFVNVLDISKSWSAKGNPYTVDGLQLNKEAYEKLSSYLADKIFGGTSGLTKHKNLVKKAVLEKNWYWQNDFKIPNGVHVFGRRYAPFGPDNYPFELKKIREMTAIRDTAIWMAAAGKQMDLSAADAKTSKLPAVVTNYNAGDYGRGQEYLYGEEALQKLHTAPGFKIELFASEQEFPELRNPVQISFDDAGRLWVAVMPSYPHYRPGDPKPNDKLLVLQDTDADGKADELTVWADSLHLPVGFELAPEGVYVSQGSHLKLLKDTDNDGKADKEEIVLSGFDDHDTHHAISAFTTDPSGAIYMGEGVFLHSNVETPYGTVRATNGGFYRYNPQRKHLERTAQVSIPNPWGIAFDDYGQPFFLETSGPALRWMLPSTIKPQYDVFSPLSKDLAPEAHKVRPTAGLEFISSRHFPDEIQGDLLLCNSIGFLGIKQHALRDDGTGYHAEHRQDLIWSDDYNFRPVDLEFAPDGSLYVADWHNILIGHMQHNARDPYRDHAHGRIYRITYPERPLVSPTNIEGARMEMLLDLLKEPEYRTRYRVRRVLRGKDPEKVAVALEAWISELEQQHPNYEHHLLEALWVSWGSNKINPGILKQLLESEDFRIRAAAVRAVRYNGQLLSDALRLLQRAAGDEHGRVRLEAIVAASWLPAEEGQSILNIAAESPLDYWMMPTYLAAQHRLTGQVPEQKEIERIPEHLAEDLHPKYRQGQEIYQRDGSCVTCHQKDGKGLPLSGFPPLAGSDWVLENDERLIKLTLHGLQGPIRVSGERYPGQVPMTPFGGILNDEEVAAVLTFVKNSFGNEGSSIDEEKVRDIREKTSTRKNYYTAEEINP